MSDPYCPCRNDWGQWPDCATCERNDTRIAAEQVSRTASAIIMRRTGKVASLMQRHRVASVTAGCSTVSP